MGKNIIIVLIFISIQCFVSCNSECLDLECNIDEQQIDTINVFSSKMYRNINVTVIKPTIYNCKELYPVLYLLNCAGESNDMWIKYMPEIVELSNISKFIFVCPDGGINSWYMDSPINEDSQYESFIIQDVLPTIEAKYSVIKNRNGRFISGISMGGHGALYLAIRNKELFSGCSSMIGGMDLCYKPDMFEIASILGDYKTNMDKWKANSVLTLVEGLKDKELNILLDSSLDDFFYEGNVQLSKKMSMLDIEHTFLLGRGGHDVYYIRQALPFHILYFTDIYRTK